MRKRRRPRITQGHLALPKSQSLSARLAAVGPDGTSPVRQRAEDPVALSRRGEDRIHGEDESTNGELYRAIGASSAHQTVRTIADWLSRGPEG